MTLPLASHRVGDLPSVYYLPDYLSSEEERDLLQHVHAAKGTAWTQLSGRRLQNYGGIVHPKGLIPSPLPRWLDRVAQGLQQRWRLFGHAPANHVLVNSYQPGEGIMPHEDGPLYHSTVAILSLGAPAVLRFWRRRPEGGTDTPAPTLSVLLEPRSLLVFEGEAYTDCLHGIEQVREERLDASVVNLHLCNDLQHAAVTSGGRPGGCVDVPSEGGGRHAADVSGDAACGRAAGSGSERGGGRW